MLNNDERQISAYNERNRFGRIHTSPIEILKSPYLSKLLDKLFKTLQNSAFYHWVDYFELEKIAL